MRSHTDRCPFLLLGNISSIANIRDRFTMVKVPSYFITSAEITQSLLDVGYSLWFRRLSEVMPKSLGLGCFMPNDGGFWRLWRITALGCNPIKFSRITHAMRLTYFIYYNRSLFLSISECICFSI
jgi:hypothetical protein